MKKIKNKECPICLESFKLKDMIETNCDHLFCHDCFFKMMINSKKKCGLCRQVQHECIISIEVEIIDCYKIE